MKYLKDYKIFESGGNLIEIDDLLLPIKDLYMANYDLYNTKGEKNFHIEDNNPIFSTNSIKNINPILREKGWKDFEAYDYILDIKITCNYDELIDVSLIYNSLEFTINYIENNLNLKLYDIFVECNITTTIKSISELNNLSDIYKICIAFRK